MSTVFISVAAADVVAWRQRRLVFRDAPLSEVAAEFNRYNRRAIRIEPTAMDERQITGTFAADRPESLVEFLRRDGDLEVVEEENELIVRTRQ